ncbi:heterokaryon incompatibility protein-domain-containing protein, partial [Phaeosphaeriaceae sp. PMI808]
ARHIRLLGYSATSNSNEVRFHLSENSLENIRGKFIAISYCWGGEKPTEYLPISSRAYLKVARTVYSILRHVAGVASGLPVWVDAICINQTDLEEKSAQVSMMGNIYAAAKCVLVWLGN